MKWLIRLLAREIAIALRQYDEETEWLNQHKTELIRARAIARIENPENANNLEYLKQTING